jgi:hypothetical protein
MLEASRTLVNRLTSSGTSSCTISGRKGAKCTSTIDTPCKKSYTKPGWRRLRSIWPPGRLLDPTVLPGTRIIKVILSLLLGKNGFT